MRFAFVSAQKADYSVSDLCFAMEVSTSGFYAWRKREKSLRKLHDETWLDRIKAIFAASRETYGSPRIHAELKALGHATSEKRVARIMRENGLAALPGRVWRCVTTETDPANAVAGNGLNRDFRASSANEKWVTDVTFVPTDEGWLYLASIIDLYNREVVGWAMSESNDTELTLRALDMALTSHNPPKGLLHHSDRGSNYTANDYRQALSDRSLEVSMSRKGNCWDNAVAESFFATLKKELVNRHHYESRRQAAAAIFEYIEAFYNRVRRHSELGYSSPIEYRKNHELAAAAA